MFKVRVCLFIFALLVFSLVSFAKKPRDLVDFDRNNMLLTEISPISIHGDYSFYWDDNHEWDPIKNRVWYRFKGLGEDIVGLCAPKYDGLSLFKFDYGDGKFKYVREIFYDIADYDTEALTDPLIFSYKDNYYVFYAFNVYRYDTGSGHEIYSGRRAAWLYAKSLSKESEWHRIKLINPEDEEYPVFRDACVVGDRIYLVYDSYLAHDGEMRHYNDEIRVKEAYFDKDNKLRTIKTFHINIEDKGSLHPYHMSWFVHPDGNARLLISYCAEKTTHKDNKGGGVIVFNPKTEAKTTIYKSDYPFSIKAVKGTIKGGAENPRGGSQIKDRIQVFYNHFTDGHWDGFHWISDKGHFYYRTYAIEKHYPLIARGEIKLGDKDYYPDEWDRMNLNVEPILVPHRDGDVVNSHAKDYYRQKVWMFYTDKHGYVRGKGFKSDSWHCISDKIVHNDDLNSTEIYGQNIKKTWTLLGLIEGPPPIPVDWDVWNRYHDTNYPPTELTYAESSETEVSFSTETEEKWFMGVSGEAEVFDYSLKFSQTFMHEKGTVHKSSTTQVVTFECKEENQGKGFLLYLAPVVYRIPYAVFPWWEDNYVDENISRTPIMYRFVTEGGQIVEEVVSLDKFGIDGNKVNDADMSVWMTDTNSNRQLLVDQYDRSAVLYAHWLSDGGVADGSFEDLKETEVATSATNEFEFEVGVDVIPEVFKISTGGAVSFTNSVKVSTSISKELEISYHNLTEADKGPKISGLYLTVYWIYKDIKGSGLWYLQNRDLVPEKSYPWYIGYVVTQVNPSEDKEGNPPQRFTVINGR